MKVFLSCGMIRTEDVVRTYVYHSEQRDMTYYQMTTKDGAALSLSEDDYKKLMRILQEEKE